jgi:hypothetical protein
MKRGKFKIEARRRAGRFRAGSRYGPVREIETLTGIEPLVSCAAGPGRFRYWRTAGRAGSGEGAGRPRPGKRARSKWKISPAIKQSVYAIRPGNSNLRIRAGPNTPAQKAEKQNRAI